jgi:hypothetical protein
MYLLPACDVTGKAPVRSVYMTRLCTSARPMAAKTLCVGVGCCGGNESGMSTSGASMVLLLTAWDVVVSGFGLVDRRFFGAWSRCPCAVAMDLGKCLRTAGADMPGHVMKLLFFMARSHVDVTGLKHAACRYCSRSGLVLVWWAWNPR